jgi:hypothetical protein
MPLKRITITIPEDLAEAADRVAETLDRSRSWVLTDAARRELLAEDRAFGAAATTATGTGRESEPRLDPSRRTQLSSDLQLTPAERVKEAEETARLSDFARPPTSRREMVVIFDSYEDYLAWGSREGIRTP